MTLKLWTLAFAGLLFAGLTGCSLQPSAGDLGRISPGASKSEVLQYLGTPSYAAGKGQVEMLYYDLATQNGPGEFFVRIVGGSVESYGKLSETDKQDPLGLADTKKK